MPQPALTREHLRTPKAAAIAGILFSVLLTTALALMRLSVPVNPLEPGAWLRTDARIVGLALNLIPFAGIAFLWFVGVVRDRLDLREDRFFATVFMGSGLLFLALLFTAAAVIGALITASTKVPEELIGSAAFRIARSIAYIIVNIYAVKMAGVFVISASTVALYTKFAPPWIALLGYCVALLLFFGSIYTNWVFLAFPAWVLVLSTYILLDNLKSPAAAVKSPDQSRESSRSR